MKNFTLAKGDLVKYFKGLESISSQGFTVGQFYEVFKNDSGLFIAVNANTVYLTQGNELTENSDYFTQHACPVILPMGQKQTRLAQ